MVLGFTFTSTVQFVNFHTLKFIFLLMMSDYSFVGKIILLSLKYLDNLVKNELTMCGSISGLSILLHRSVCLSFSQ